MEIMMEKQGEFEKLFTDKLLTELFPEDKSDQFFELLYGDAQEGAYDIGLSYEGYQPGQLKFVFNLKRRPGKCLACNLTYGLPEVFSRHPVLDIAGLIQKLQSAMDGSVSINEWQLGRAQEISKDLHIIDLDVFIDEKI